MNKKPDQMKDPMAWRHWQVGERMKEVMSMKDEELVSELSWLSRSIGEFDKITIGGRYAHSDDEEVDISVCSLMEDELVRRLKEKRS